jgi:HEAT repeat protein
LTLSTLTAGCFTLEPRPAFDSSLPQDRFLAIRRAGRDPDPAAVPSLVRQLAADDLLARSAAADALRRITGTTLGFEPDAPIGERRDAIGRWTDWIDAGLATPPPEPVPEHTADD